MLSAKLTLFLDPKLLPKMPLLSKLSQLPKSEVELLLDDEAGLSGMEQRRFKHGLVGMMEAVQAPEVSEYFLTAVEDISNVKLATKKYF